MSQSHTPRMSAADFAAWVRMMQVSRRMSKAEISRALGAGINQTYVWVKRGAPGYIGLACTALEHNLEPWRQPQ